MDERFYPTNRSASDVELEVEGICPQNYQLSALPYDRKQSMYEVARCLELPMEELVFRMGRRRTY